MLTRLIPSDPAMMWVGRFASAEQVARARELLGLDRAWYVQYFKYCAKLVRGDLGVSVRTHAPVSEEILQRLPASLELITIGMGCGIALGICFGMMSAVKPNSAIDQVGRFLCVAGVALPQFWLAMILQLIFGKALGLFPLVGRLDPKLEILGSFQRITGWFLIDSTIALDWQGFSNSVVHIILPALSLAAYPLAISVRLVRVKMVEILGTDYIRTARAYGVSEARVLTRYALRNAIGPILSMSGTSFVYTLVGTFMIESIFAWPGIGYYTAMAIMSNDVAVIVGMVVLIAVVAVSVNFVIDIGQAWIDPRIRIS